MSLQLSLWSKTMMSTWRVLVLAVVVVAVDLVVVVVAQVAVLSQSVMCALVALCTPMPTVPL